MVQFIGTLWVGKVARKVGASDRMNSTLAVNRFSSGLKYLPCQEKMFISDAGFGSFSFGWKVMWSIYYILSLCISA